MFITTTTSSKLTPEMQKKVRDFLVGFLPRLNHFSGVKAIYHYQRPEQGEEVTIIVWESQDALKKYRDSALFQEAVAFEKEHKLSSSREGYPLYYPTT